MSSEKAELKARLMGGVEAIVEQMLAAWKPAGENSLSDIERVAVASGRALETLVAQELVDVESKVEGEPVCETCRQRMRSRGRRKRQVVTEAGEVTLKRGYYVCPSCGERAFPPG